MNELNPALRSTVHVPVKSNGGFGRGFLRLSGARAPSGMTGISFPAGGFCCADVHGARIAKKMAPASARAGLNPELPIFLTPLCCVHPFLWLPLYECSPLPSTLDSCCLIRSTEAARQSSIGCTLLGVE